MTPGTFKQTMDNLDFTTADVALIMGVTRRAVQLWVSGASPVPQSCAMVLQGIHEGLLTMEWVENQIIAAMQIA